MAKKSPAKFQLENTKDDVVAAEVLVAMSGATLGKEEAINLEKMKIKILARCREEIVTNQTHHIRHHDHVQELAPQGSIDGSILSRYPPIPNLEGKIVLGACSVPFEKQLTPTDVKDDQNRLSLSKDEVIRSILPLLDSHEDPFQGIVVTTYNPQGKTYEMTFKSWSDNKFYVLNGGWKKFYQDNGLKEYRDWVTVWMFRHIQTRKVCFALTWKSMPMNGPCPRPKSQKQTKIKR